VIGICSLALFAACAHTHTYHPDPAYRIDVDRVLAEHTRSTREVAAPAALEPKPWKVGQWALYKRAGKYVTDGFEGYEKISVIAEDSCGVWIVDESHGYVDRHRWTFCLRRPDAATEAHTDPVDLVQVAIWESNGGPPDIVDLRFGQNSKESREILLPVAAQLLPRHWSDPASLPREDIDVPAGHFLQALRMTVTRNGTTPGADTRWAHPDVPFDATIRRLTSDGRDYVLLAYGDNGEGGVVPKLATVTAAKLAPAPTPANYVRIGFGYGWLSGHSTEQSSEADSLSMMFGFRVSPKVDVVVETGGLVGATYSPDPTRSQSTYIALLGARWAPFRQPYVQIRPQPRGASALYVQADIGYTELLRDTINGTDTAARGLVLGAGVGWLGINAHDWAMGFELEDHVSFLNRSEGVRNSVGLLALWQLYLPWQQ